MTDSATFTTPENEDEDLGEDLGDLLLEVLPPDGSTIGNLSAREALSRAAERQISEEEYEEVKDKALTLGLLVKGRGRGGSIALAEGIEGGSRYEAPSAPAAGNGRGRAKKEAPAKDFKAVLKRYKYPPDQEAAAIELVLQQTEMISEEWSREDLGKKIQAVVTDALKKQF